MSSTPKYRPETFNEIIGMTQSKEKVSYAIRGAKSRGTKYPHFLIAGPSGLGKTTLANIISMITDGNVHKILGNNLKKPDDIYNLSAICKDGDIIYIEEAHGMAPMAQTTLLPWMEDCELIGGVAGNTGNLAPNVCFILPTTDAGRLPEAFRNRCLKIELDYYSIEDLNKIIIQYCINNKVSVPEDQNVLMSALNKISRSARGTPRVVLSRLESILNVMSLDSVELTSETVDKAFKIYGVNEYGLDKHDLTYCHKLYELQKSSGCAVSFKTMMQSTGFADNVVSNIIEAYLMQAGIIAVSNRGRSLTDLGFHILGKEPIVVKEGQVMDISQDKSLTKPIIKPSTEIDREDLKARIVSKEILTMQQIAAKYGLTYGKHNPYMASVLAEIGFKVKQRIGIVPINA